MLNKKFLSILALIFAAFFCQENCQAKEAPELSFSDFIEQVKNQNLNYSYASQNARAFEMLRRKGELVSAIKLYGYGEKSFAEQNSPMQIFPYDRTYLQKNQIGFTHASELGLNTNIYYSLNKLTYKGLNTSRFPDPELARSSYQAMPTISLSLSLWQNRFGSSTRAQKDSAFFENETKKLQSQALSKETLVLAQKTYWNLVYARRAVEIEQAALNSSRQILDYVSKKEVMNLGEKADVLQAKALFELRKSALQMAQNSEKLAAREFNKQRYVNSAEVPERLSSIDFAAIENFLVPKVKADDRFDIKAQETNMKAAIAAAKVEEENNKPALNLYGSYSTNQYKKSANLALGNSFDERGRGGTLGVNFSMPINFSLSSEIRQGALANASAAKINYRQKTFEQENDWENLVQNLSTYKANLRLARNIEDAQKKKLENERSRLRQGRTSTYQVLLFEQDYSNSQLNTIQVANALLGLIAEEKLYHQ
jgi:outer membrane protein TolC